MTVRWMIWNEFQSETFTTVYYTEQKLFKSNENLFRHPQALHLFERNHFRFF